MQGVGFKTQAAGKQLTISSLAVKVNEGQHMLWRGTQRQAQSSELADTENGTRLGTSGVAAIKLKRRKLCPSGHDHAAAEGGPQPTDASKPSA